MPRGRKKRKKKHMVRTPSVNILRSPMPWNQNLANLSFEFWVAKVKPVYQRLSEDSLLEKCLHGKTQNQNEAVNGMVWERIPKDVFVGADLLEFGLFDAINHFNIGARAVLLLLKALKISPGKYTEEGCRHLDMDRIRGAEYKHSEERKKRRKVLRGQRKKTRTNKQRVLLMLLEHFKTLALLRDWTEGFQTQIQLLNAFFHQTAFW